MCNSCEKGFNGTNGNGYQPCECDEIPKSTGRDSIATVKTRVSDDSEDNIKFIFGFMIGFCIACLFILGIVKG